MNNLNLNGTWRLRWSDGQRGRPEYADRVEVDESRYIDAIVPGEVHLDLLRLGLIPDFYVQGQAKECRWVEDCIWSYRRFFEAPEAALQGRAWLCFENLDLAATIVLNGEKLATHQNVFLPCRVDVTNKLKAGRNLLTVHVDAGLLAVSEKPHAGYCLGGFDQKLHKRHWLRKPQSQFSWDWSPRLMNIGISGDVRLEYASHPVRLEQFVALVDVSPNLDHGSIRGRFFLEKLSSAKSSVTVRITLQGSDILAEKVVEVAEGMTCELNIEIPLPKLWWPRGHGEQNLYSLHASVEVDGTVIAEQTRRVGFRRVRVNQESHADGGNYFVFEINNRPIFLKGANIVPSDLIVAAADRQRYAVLIGRAVEANFNFLRVWGGGLYESEDFYDLCDEQGIVVWQEFVYACAKYPLHDEAFFTEAKKEATYQIRRLAHRPSLIAWCGNNEIDMFDAWPISEQGMIHPDYAFFHSTLPRLMREEDPSRYFQPSSPYSPDNFPPNQDDRGDQHPWSIGFFDIDFYKYRDMACRFPNEGGFLGPTALPTMLSCLKEPGQIGSFAWQYHDNSVDSWAEPSPVDKITQEWLGRNIRDMSVEEFTYWGGLLQGEALREYIESFRRKMFDSACACFWMFNDCWPATRSWTVVDHALRRTPSFHPVARSFAPVHVVIAQVDQDIRIYGINETQETVSARLHFGAFELGGKYGLDQQQDCALPPNASTVLAFFPAASLAGDAAAFATLEANGKLLARNRLFVRKFREMTWPAATVAVALDGNTARFSSDVFVWGVCLDLEGKEKLGDNFFDLYPGMDYVIPWSGAEAPRILHTGNLSRA